MKKILGLSFILLTFPLSAFADTIVFKDGVRVVAARVWEQDGEVQCEINGIVFGYPKTDVARIEKNGSLGEAVEMNTLEVYKEEVTAGVKKQAAVAKKDQTVPEKEAGTPPKAAASADKPASISKTETAGLQKKAPVPEAKTSMGEPAKPLAKKPALPAQKEKEKGRKAGETIARQQKAPEAAATESAGSLPFKVIINEDDLNPPAYIKLQRVLLVSPGLTRARIRALLLSYEKKLRDELNARKARYKKIVVWAYDDFDSADEGAAGWVGMISNEPAAGILSDAPELLIP